MRFLLPSVFLLTLIVLANGSQVQTKNEFRSELQIFQQFVKYINRRQTLFDKLEFKKIIDLLAFSQYILRNPSSTFNAERETITCVACRAAVNVFIDTRRNGASEEDLTQLGIEFCTLLQIQSPQVCRGVVGLHVPTLVHLIDNVPEMSGETFCAVLLQSEDPNACYYKDDRFEWTIDIPPKTSLTQKSSETFKKAESFKILHISDIHYDPKYEVGGVAGCKDPICCRKGQKEKTSPRQMESYNDDDVTGRTFIDSNNNIYLNLNTSENVRRARMQEREKNAYERNSNKDAGFWGDYRHCDMPWWSVEESIDHITETQKSFNYVYYTGDTIDHAVWETSKQLVRDSVTKTTEKFKQAFGKRPVYQIVGNHESHPVNQFVPKHVTDEDFSYFWLYDLLWEQWKFWLPAEAEVTVRKGGYYTDVPEPGFRVVVLNSNLCYIYNWWVQYDPQYSREQLEWLVEVLTLAEKNNEMVHILSHIPPGMIDTPHVCTREYKRIIERFSHIIKGEFNGHTHRDEFKLFYSREDSKPILAAWNGGSITTYTDVNPNYRLYHVDSNNFEIQDMETWVYNLTEANLTPSQRPRWFLEYTFKDKYKVASLNPQDIDNLIERLVTVDQSLLVEDYENFRGKSSDPFVNRKCDDNCVKANLHYLLVTELYDNRKYNEMYAKYLVNKP